MLDVVIEDGRWAKVDLETLAVDALSATLDWADLRSDIVEVSVLGCDDTRITALNGDFRGKPAPTNVLSWPTEDLAADAPGAAPRKPGPGPDGLCELGDVALAYDTCVREAAALSKPVADHVTHLLVHGILHLLGYDHIHDEDAALMQQIESKILGKMGIDDPY